MDTYSLKKKTPTKFWVFLLLGMLFFVYLFSLATYFMRTPSEGFSRETLITTVDYGAIINLKTAVISSTAVNGSTTMVTIGTVRYP